MSCAVLTRDAVGPASEVHDRMPVVLSKETEDAWLDQEFTDAAQAMALAMKDGLTTVEHHPVNSRVNIAGNDDEGMVRKVNE